MKAGREVDALVAQRVMGHQIMWHSHPGHKVLYLGGDTEAIPPYSTDIAAAWEVVESPACEGGHKFQLFCEHNVWTAVVSGIGQADAPTAPLAICLAALKSVGVEVKDA